MATIHVQERDAQGNLVNEYDRPISDEDAARATNRDAAVNALQQLESSDANWNTLTAAQKDAAARLVVRVCAKLIRLMLTP